MPLFQRFQLAPLLGEGVDGLGNCEFSNPETGLPENDRQSLAAVLLEVRGPEKQGSHTPVLERAVEVMQRSGLGQV